MSTINSGPNIPSNGLLMCLDAGNNKSYSGAGSVWRDLSSNNYDCNLFGSPSWDGQKFIFPKCVLFHAFCSKKSKLKVLSDKYIF